MLRNLQLSGVGGWAKLRCWRTAAISQQRNQSDQAAPIIHDPYVKEKQSCLLCRTKIPISYKNPQLLSQFVSPNTGFVFDRRITGLCEAQQRRVEVAVYRSRKIGLMPYLYRDPIFLKDNNMFFDPYLGDVNIGKRMKIKKATGDELFEDEDEMVMSEMEDGTEEEDGAR